MSLIAFIAALPFPKVRPAWLPAPANRPELPDFAEPLPAALTGGWFDSSLDLKLGLEVADLGAEEWLGEWDGGFACA